MNPHTIRAAILLAPLGILTWLALFKLAAVVAGAL